MSRKYVFKSGFLTICSCEIEIFMLLKLPNQVLRLRLVTSYPLSPSSSYIVHLFDIGQTFFVFFCFKFVRIFLGKVKLFIMLTTLFFSSSFILPARKWPSNFGFNSWLWIPLSMANHLYSSQSNHTTYTENHIFLSPCLQDLVSFSSSMVCIHHSFHIATSMLDILN